MSNHYLPRAQLRQYLIESKQAGRYTPEFIDAVRQICEGILDRQRFAGIDPDDMIQDVWCCLSRPEIFERLSPDGNIFAYITSVCFNFARRDYALASPRNRLADKYARHQIAAGNMPCSDGRD